MKRFLDALPYTILLPAALLLGLSPFVPQPHLLEKLRMLVAGQLTRPLDQFDLLLHAAPILLLTLKSLVDLRRRP